MASPSLPALGLAAPILTPSKTTTAAAARGHHGPPSRISVHNSSARLNSSRARRHVATGINAADDDDDDDDGDGDNAYISDSHPSTPGRYGPTLTQYAEAQRDQNEDAEAYDEAAARIRRRTESTPPTPPSPARPAQPRQAQAQAQAPAVTGNASDSSLSDCSLLSDMTLPDMDPSEDWEGGLREAGIDMCDVSGGSGDEENVAPHGYQDGRADGSESHHMGSAKRRRLGLADPLQARGGTSGQGSARAGKGSSSKRNGEKDYRQPTSTSRVTTVPKTYRRSQRRRRDGSAGADVSNSDMDISTDGQSGDSSSGIEVASTRKPAAPSARFREAKGKGRETASTSASPLESRPSASGRKPAEKRRAKVLAVGAVGADMRSDSEGCEEPGKAKKPYGRSAARMPSSGKTGPRRIGSNEDMPSVRTVDTTRERRRSSRKGKERASEEVDGSDGAAADQPVHSHRTRTSTARPVEVPFQALSTATSSPALTALEIIAQLRAKNMASRGVQADVSMDQSSRASPDGHGALAAAASAGADGDDDSDDDLADPSLLIKRAAIRPAAATMPVAAASAAAAAAAAQTGPSAPKPPINTKNLPKDKSKFALDKLYKSREAEGGRGWFGIEQAGQQAAAAAGGSSDEEGDRSAAPDSGHGESGADVSRHSSGAGTSAGAGGKEAMERLSAALQKDQRSLEAVQILSEETEEMRLRNKKEEGREERKFWLPEEDLKIEVSPVAFPARGAQADTYSACGCGRAQPYVPYEPAGRTGLDLAVCQGIIGRLLATANEMAPRDADSHIATVSADGIANPHDFPIHLCSSFLSSPQAIRSTVPMTYALYNLVAHPCTAPQLAESALRMLTCLLEKLPTGGDADTDIELYYISDSLLKMGAKPDHIPVALLEDGDVHGAMQGVESGASRGQAAQGKQPYTAQDRRAATMRLLRVLKVLVATG